MKNSATRWPSRLEWALLPLLLAMVVAFGGLVEMRSAFLSRRMGDLGCYLRPAWAAAVGKNIYDAVEDNGWHFNYPPLYAILLIPLADPPPGEDTAGFVPYHVSVAIVYVLNIACLFLAVHVLATAFERCATNPAYRDQPRFCRRWWALRSWPVLACLPSIAHTAMRGQVNLQVLVLLCAWIGCALASRRAWSGIFLGVAICIKVIPVYLLVYPCWRRDGRAIGGCAVGLFAGLVVVPLAVFGPARTVDEYQRYGQVLFGPILGLSDDLTRHDELLDTHSTDSMGIKNAVHSWLYPDQYQRPHFYHPAETWLYRILGALTTLAALWPMRRQSSEVPWRTVHTLGTLLLLMVVFSPVSHVHYFTFCLPLVMSLMFRRWQFAATLHLGWPLTLALVWFVAACALPALPDFELLKDMRVPLLGALPLWVFAMIELWRLPAAEAGDASSEMPRLAA
jgi:hypothetical protein